VGGADVPELDRAAGSFLRIKAPALNSKDFSIYVALICGAALVVLNPMVVGIFVHPLRAHNIRPLLLCLDGILGIIVVTSILYIKTGRRGWFITSLSMLFLLPILMVFAELAVAYYRLVYVGQGTVRYQQLLEPDPEFGWRLKANAHAREIVGGSYDVFYEIDQERRKGIPQNEGAKSAIHFFGDSFIFGQGVNNEETAVNLLANKLQGHFNILNYGVPGYGIEQMLLSFRSRLSDIQPDDVVMFAPVSGSLKRNFIHRAHFCKYVLEYSHENSPSLPMWTGNGWVSVRVSDECSALEALLLNSSGLLGRLYRWRHENKVADEILVNADRVFSEAAKLAKKRGASFHVVFITNPLECERRAFEVGIDNLKTPFASFLPYCPEDKELLRRFHFPLDYHWTAEGNRWAAGVLEQILRTEFRLHAPERSQ
jgi:hypothetical protein